tara:strand:- start:1320 stop:1757 length:438 start_codon:yes stop_codon:yes gene_type:complete
MQKLFSVYLALFSLIFSASCGSISGGLDQKQSKKQLFDRFAERLPAKLKPYKVDIVQGNYVTNSMVSNLSKGQTRDQVRTILGTPLIIDPFRKNRWDYLFLINRGSGKRVIHRFMVMFENDRVVAWEGSPIDEKSGNLEVPKRKY